MKRTVTRITALLLAIMMMMSLLASCQKGEDVKSSADEDDLSLRGTYKTQRVDLGLAEGEILIDIIEVDGKLRATVGVPDPNDYGNEFDSIFYLTEHRWYGLDYSKDPSPAEKTAAHHELTFVSDPTVDLSFGGEHFDDEWRQSGIKLHIYQDGVIQEGEIGYAKAARLYGIPAHIMVYEGVPYVSFNNGGVNDRKIVRAEAKHGENLYINDHNVTTDAWKVGDPYYIYCGLIGIEGKPYALLEIEGKGRIVPLTPDATELTFDGVDIEGCPTGGAFSDGKFGYFMSGSELWQTNGTESRRLVDLAVCGISLTSVVRSVRAVSDGRILVSAEGELIELSPSEEGDEEVYIFDIGLYTFDVNRHEYSYSDIMPHTLSVLAAEYNKQAKYGQLRIREFKNLTDLNLALLSGEVAMVITPDRFALNNYIKQELLAPLDEAAPALFEKDVLIENVVDAARVNGVSYYIPTDFDIRGENITDPALLKDGKLFETREEYYDFITKNDPEYFRTHTPEEIFDHFGAQLDEWIDWENHTAHFDDGRFEELLELAVQGRPQDEVDQYIFSAPVETQHALTWLTGGFQLLDTVQSYRFTDPAEALARRNALDEVNAWSGDLSTWVELDFPMPSEVHKGFEISAFHYYAVVNNEKSKKAAGDFLTWMILEDVDEEFDPHETWVGRRFEGFSINRDETDRMLAAFIDGAVDPEEEVSKLSAETVLEFPMTVNLTRLDARIHNSMCGQTQYEVTWDYIESADHLAYNTNELYAVMLEEAKRYFGGAITAKQAADYVQNRISLYLAEQS